MSSTGNSQEHKSLLATVESDRGSDGGSTSHHAAQPSHVGSDQAGLPPRSGHMKPEKFGKGRSSSAPSYSSSSSLSSSLTDPQMCTKCRFRHDLDDDEDEDENDDASIYIEDMYEEEIISLAEDLARMEYEIERNHVLITGLATCVGQMEANLGTLISRFEHGMALHHDGINRLGEVVDVLVHERQTRRDHGRRREHGQQFGRGRGSAEEPWFSAKVYW